MAIPARIGIGLALLLVPLPALRAEEPARPFPDLLIPEDGRPVPGVPTPVGTLIRNKQDFILCAGKDFQNPAAQGDSAIEWNNTKDGRPALILILNSTHSFTMQLEHISYYAISTRPFDYLKGRAHSFPQIRARI